MAKKNQSNGLGCLTLIALAGVVYAWSYHWTLGVLSLFIIGYVVYRTGTAQARRSQRQLQDIAQREAILDATRHMSGIEFEELMTQFFRSIGYKAQMTKASGDQGVDLLLQKDGRRTAVQLKRYSKPVGNKAVQEALAGMMFYKTQEAWVVTTSSFTKAAVELANGTGVRLVDGLELGGWIKDISSPRAPNTAPTETTFKPLEL
jgi:restriction system protein